MSSQIYLMFDNNGTPDYYELTCTQDISINKSNSVTDLPVEAGFSIADNSFPAPIKFNIKGILTEIVNVSLDYHRSPEECIKNLHRLMDQGTPCTLSVDDVLELYPDVIIEKMSLVKSSGMGTSWNANIDLKQIIVTQKAKRKRFPPQQPDTDKQSKEKVRQGDNSTEEKKITATLFTQGGVNLLEASPYRNTIGAFVASEEGNN